MPDRDPVRWTWLGRVDYVEAARLQESLNAARSADQIGDTLLLLEHPPVITLGRRGSMADIVATPEHLDALGVSVHATNRGGLVTYHGPGQIIGYVIGRLADLGGTAPAFVYGLEETVIQAVAEFDIMAGRRGTHRGVWIPEGKLAAIGVTVRRGVTMHGFALNVHTDLRHFELINPCGIGDLGVTSVERVLGHPVDESNLRQALAFHLGRAFGRSIEWLEPTFRAASESFA